MVRSGRSTATITVRKTIRSPCVDWTNANINPQSAAGANSAAEYLENERRRMERETECIHHGQRSIFEIGLPPSMYPGNPNYAEYVQEIRDELGNHL